MRPKNRQELRTSLVTVRGVIELIDSESGDHAMEAVLISDDEEELYLEIPGGIGKLREYADMYVQATGFIYERDGRMIISAKRITEAEPFDEYAANEWDNYRELYDDDDIQEIVRSARRSGGLNFREDFYAGWGRETT